jgi:hypothetical protein
MVLGPSLPHRSGGVHIWPVMFEKSNISNVPKGVAGAMDVAINWR